MFNQETAYYEEGNGAYISVIPAQRTIQLLQHLWIPDKGLAPSQWHVTVIFDKSSNISSEDFYTKFPLVGCDNMYTATAGKIVSWRGQKDKIFRVLSLESPELETLHDYLRRTCNFNHSFPQFKPHMTLIEDEENILPDDDSLVGAKLSFGGLRIESLKV